MNTWNCQRCYRITPREDRFCDSCAKDFTPDPLRNLKVPSDLPPGNYSAKIVGGEVVIDKAVTVEGQLQPMLCITALRELVRLKDIKERMEDLVTHPASMHGSREEFKRLREEYETLKEPAWDAARRALG